MTKSLVLAALALVLLIGSACTYRGAVKEDSYHAETEVGKKFPYKVAVLVDDQARSVKFDAQASLFVFSMEFDFFKAIGHVLQQELQTVFEQVSVVEDRFKAQEYDLLASATVDVIANGGIEYPPQFETKLSLELKDLRSGVVLAKESQSKRVPGTWRSSGQFMVCNLLLVYFLISTPCITDAVGDRIMEEVEKELPRLVQTLVADVQADGRVATYVRGRSGGQAVAAVPMTKLVPFSDVDYVRGGSGGQAVAAVPVTKLVPFSDVDVVSAGLTPRKKPAYAIVVGIEQYRQDLPRADFADHDAKIMREYLVKRLGYEEENVVLLSNDHATKTDIEKYVEKWLPNRVDPGDSVFVYFSGHGSPNPKTGDAYLIPFDGDPAYLETTGYSLKRLYDNLAKLPAKEIVVLLDSCFSGAGGRSVLAKGARPMVNVMPVSVIPANMAVLAASSGEQVSSTYTQKSHGLLTYFFLKGLQGEGDQDKDGVISLGELFAYVKPQVQRVARREYNNDQVPQLLGQGDMLKKGVRLADYSKP